MPNKELQNLVSVLEDIDRTVGLDDGQKKQLRKAKRSLHFAWIAALAMHVACIIVCVLMYLHLRHLYHVQAIRSASDSVEMSLTKAESSQRGYLLTGRDAYLTDYTHNVKILDERVAELCELIPTNPYNSEICHTIDMTIAVKLEEMQSTIDAAKAGRPEESLEIVRTDKGFNLMTTITRTLSRIHYADRQ
jgi:CHASE3 domain sensor protein